MPVTKSARKKLRKDRKREKLYDKFRREISLLATRANKEKSPKSVSRAISIVDKAVKKHLFHRNKAARIKSRLSKLVKISPTRSTSAVKKKTVRIKKTPQKKKTR